MKRVETIYRTTLSMALMIALAVTGCAAAAVPQSPEGAVHNVVNGLAANHPEVFWQALPASYQADVNGLVEDFANQMDPDIWNQSFGVFAKATQVLSEKKEFILANPLVAQQLANKPEIEQNWDGMVGLLNIIAASQISTVEQLRNLNIEAFLADTVGELMSQAEIIAALSDEDPREELRKLQNVSVNVISNDGSRAVLELSDGDGPPRQVEFLLVEGKWIPREMSEEWPQAIGQARSEIAEISSHQMLEQKEALLASLTMADSALDSLLAAQDINEFNMAVQTLIGVVMMQAMSHAQDAQSGK